MTLSEAKAIARKTAFQRRKTADPAAAAPANRHLIDAVRAAPGHVVSGYWPIRTEIDPRPAMFALAETHALCLPVVVANGAPLEFRRWSPGAAMTEGAFGASIPETDETCVPETLIVPLAAFSVDGYRLGYGGGFYDRTLALLRGAGKVTAIGFAFEAQLAEDIPIEPTDQPLDLLVTEAGARRF